jgi:hypothetical protein
VPTRTALPTPTNQVAVLSSNTIQITNLRQISIKDVNTSSGPVRVIELKADAANITGLTLQGPCINHTRVNTTANQDNASGGATIDATALQATILGVSIIIAAQDIPITATLNLPGITLPPLPTNLGILSVKLFVLSINSGAMALSGANITSAAC